MQDGIGMRHERQCPADFTLQTRCNKLEKWWLSCVRSVYVATAPYSSNNLALRG
jgi:hypothetical protein